MEPIAALHNAARQHCLRQIDKWHRKYADLRAASLDRDIIRAGEWEYSRQAYNTFPRYSVVGAILADVERFKPADFSEVDECREMLAACGETAENEFTKIGNATEASAMEAERRAFVDYVKNVTITECVALTLLPNRRVLTRDEHKEWMKAFGQGWGSWYGGCVAGEPRGPYITLHTRVMETPHAYEGLRGALVSQGVSRVLELREWGEGFEVDLITVDFLYNGAEGFWTQPDLAWMVQASHEASITFGGEWLINAMKAVLPEFDRFIYRGWDHATYD